MGRYILNNKNGFRFDFPKNHMIPMGPYAQKDSCNFFHWLFKKFAMGFIAFVNRFKQRKEITFIKERSGTIIFNMILDSLGKRAQFENMINIFAILLTKIANICNFLLSSNWKITSGKSFSNSQPKENLYFRKQV